ncbi:glycosyltransferase family 9 protein [Microbacterium sp. STN6]|uniref:glycosyltransferase family 9 protein n=1 Tax=Microbacterium sp. STN6 TaxID=2995588 RepID=UPI002260C139|nr:glycosyltransferase family 9 protein [Microbacterium sp. STN6]MCX7523149.1 glycosyltransferase family 9 protein [Microbacterium sp. STN6]
MSDDALSIGPLGERIPGVRSIAVLRGGGLGDLLFAMPAVDSLAAAYPGASITMLGTPLHAELLNGRPGPVAGVELLPPAPGIFEAEPSGDAGRIRSQFFERMRERSFDLAVQVHGGGGNSNPFVLELGAAHTVGLQAPGAPPLDRTVPYRYYQHEMLRALEVVGLVGAAPVRLEPRLQVTDAERQRARNLLGRSASSTPAPLLVVHPGATDPRRRWPAERFAEVAERALAAGMKVVVVGDASDGEAAERIVRMAGGGSGTAGGGAAGRIRSLAGHLRLGELAGLLREADVFVGNDSGPRHLALAVGCPTVGVFWFGNVINAGPLSRSRHRIHIAWRTTCPVCGREQVRGDDGRCEHDDSFVSEVPAADVWADVAELARPAAP